MEMKPGYKQTEVGLIPKEWRVETIDKLIDEGFIIGHLDGNHGELYPRSHEFKSHGVPYIGANDFEEGSVSFERCKFLTPERAKRFRKGVAKDGDVLFAHNATVGPVALLRTNESYVILSTTATYFRCDLDKLNNVYLKATLQSEYFVRQYQPIMAQSTRFQVPITTQRKLSLVVPPLPEQRAIAEMLSDVDGLLGGLDRLIAKKRGLKQAAMQQLLTGQTRLPGFHGEWEVKTLEKLFEITSSKRVFQREWRTEGIPFYRARELAVLGETGSVDNELFITRELYETHRRAYGVPEVGDMLVTGVGTLGKVYVVTDDREFYFKDGNIIWFRIGKKMSAEFLRQLYLAEAMMKQIAEGAAGTTVGTYTISAAKKTRIPFPPLPEQTAIAGVLTDMDAELAALEQRREKTRALKQAMMQELLTGKTRLISSEESYD